MKLLRPHCVVLFWAIGFSIDVAAEARTPVAVSVVRSLNMSEEVSLHGSLVAIRRAQISSEVDGLVVEVNADDGDRVSVGMPLAELDRKIAQLNVKEAQAQLEAARAIARESKRRHVELSELRGKRHVSETEVAAARARTEIDHAQASAAQTRLARAQEITRQHSILSPFNAVVIRKLIETGEWVETNSALFELVDVDRLRLEVPVPQHYFSQVVENTRVTIEFDALRGERFEATVTRKVPISDPSSRTFRARIDLANPKGRLAPGMSARVVFKLGDEQSRPVTAIPRDSIVRKPDGVTSVWQVTENDGVTIAIPRIVKLGRSYRNHVEILESEIAPGDHVVVRGNEILRPGQSIVIAEEIVVGF